MSTTTHATDVVGPIDFVLLEFPLGNLDGSAAEALLDLVERGTIRLYDLMLISKNDDGTVTALDISEPGIATGFESLSGARSGLLGDDDVAEAAAAMQPGTLAALIVYENAWAVPFVAAARANGGELVASARIPASDVMAVLEALDQD